MSDNFITEIIDRDLANGTGAIATRFPPEPNGYLHIGHAKSVCLNFSLAQRYGGRCHLRFDDTNPLKEETAYVESIQQDVRWLGFDWGEHLYFASDWFDRMYEVAQTLVRKGLAYVDSQSVEEIREQRGGFGVAGVDSPFRGRGVTENLELLERMKHGEFPDGSHVLRAKIDMSHPNMVMRDPLLYRIRHATHHRTADKWCIYPMYDFAHCLEDAFEGITHSICTLEFESNRELYDWVLDAIGGWRPRPRQHEFARLKLDYTVTSKRKLLRLVQEGIVEGWDDPRMPTLAGMRRRGITPAAIRSFAEMVGVAKNNTVVDIGKLEYCIRQDLETTTQRAFAVVDPLPLEVTNWPVERYDALSIPWRAGGEESREVPFGRHLLIERDDFHEAPPKGWKRLAPGVEVRLMGAYLVTCTGVERDADGHVTKLLCTADLASRGGAAPDGRKVKGTLHWLSADHALPCEVRLFDRLFTVADPESDPEVDFVAHVNPHSLIHRSQARVEPALAATQAESRFQFVRQGYFVADRHESAPGRLVFNRVIELRDSWGRRDADQLDSGTSRERTTPQASKTKDKKPLSKRKASDLRVEARAADPRLQEAFERFESLPGWSGADADLLTGEYAVMQFVDDALNSGAPTALLARWGVNVLLSVHRSQPLDSAAMTGGQFADLLKLLHVDALSKAAAKRVLSEMVDTGRDPAVVIEDLGVGIAANTGDLAVEVVNGVLSAHATEVGRFAGGEKQLMGFFMGQAMRAAQGRVDGQTLRQELMKQLNSGG